MFKRRVADFTDRTVGRVMDLDDYQTISTFSDAYFTARGCYDGCCENQGNVRAFIQGSVRGGICYANPDFLKLPITFGVCDFDAKSMYASAMKRIGHETGYPVGPCQPLTDLSYPVDQPFYVVRIRVHAITKHQQIPFVSEKVDGVTVRYNMGELPTGDLVVDKLTLEDWISFCGLEFTILEGVYWEGDFNDRIEVVIEDLFRLRQELRQDGNPLQSLCKLLMNAGYGKLAIKKTNNKYLVRKNRKLLPFVKEMFGIFKQAIRFGGHSEVEIAHYDESYSRNHLGSMVLSMSKRILGEVLHMCNRLRIPVTYVDTDSMHIQESEIQRLVDCYYFVTQRQLIGDGLGQFHGDFDLGCGHNSNIVSYFSLILGPKAYYDKLLCNICGREGEHHRMKGIPERSITKYCVDHGITVQECYERLVHEALTFVLNPPECVRMRVKIGCVYNLPANTFVRTVKF